MAKKWFCKVKYNGLKLNEIKFIQAVLWQI